MSETKPKTWRLDTVGEIGRMVSANSWELSYADHGRLSTFEENEQGSEQALRKLRDALVEHFAPVLRWQGETASVGAWRLRASDREWAVITTAINEWDVTLRGDKSDGLTESRRAAETALRALGVVFRTEGE